MITTAIDLNAVSFHYSVYRKNMKDSGGGAIVNVGSSVGKTGDQSDTLRLFYAKAGLHSLTQTCHGIG
jgi:short-subunit dehydrogenase